MKGVCSTLLVAFMCAWGSCVLALFPFRKLYAQHDGYGHLGNSVKIAVSMEVDGKASSRWKDRVRVEVCDCVADFFTFEATDFQVPSDCSSLQEADADYILQINIMVRKKFSEVNIEMSVKKTATDEILSQESSTVALKGGSKAQTISNVVSGVNELLFKAKRDGLWEKLKGVEVATGGLKGEPEESSGMVPTADLLIAVSQEGAKVYVDDKLVGTAPVGIVRGLSVGTHNIVVEMDGFKRYSDTVIIDQSELNKVIRKDVVLSSREKRKKRGAILRKWWLWTIVGGLLGGGVTATVIGLTRKGEPNAISFPEY